MKCYDKEKHIEINKMHFTVRAVVDTSVSEMSRLIFLKNNGKKTHKELSNKPTL